MDISHFSVIDRVLAIDVAKGTICSQSRVPMSDTLFEGHFPGMPLLPGTIQTEIMAQSAGLLALVHTAQDRMAVLAGVDRARFRRQVQPGALLEANAALEYESPRLMTFKCDLRDGETSVADATIRLVLLPHPNSETLAYSEALADRVGLYSVDAGVGQ